MERETEKTPLSRADQAGKEQSILVADDDDVIRILVTTLLEKAGYSVIKAVDGFEAVNKFMEHQEEIDLLVFDVRMPGKDGKQAYDEIRQIRPDIKVLFISGYGSDILKKHGIIKEEFEVLPKPFMPGDLISRIRTCLGNTRN
jgi:two-component system cell cycle sensor histidine kinase/response regulator CckA